MFRKFFLFTAAGVIAVASVSQLSTSVSADSYDDQIRAIQSQIDQYQASSKQLKDKAQSLEKELTHIALEKQTIQGQVDLSQARYDKLQYEAAATQIKIVNNKDALGSIIANMYVDADISPLEMLASSKNVADYMDKSSYQSSISDQLKDTISTINNLKKSLENQQASVKRVLGEQQLAKQALANKEGEQQKILAETKGQEASYDALTANRKQHMGELYRKQQAAIEAAMRRGGGSFDSTIIGDASKGGYPWEEGCWVDANAWSFGGANGNGTDPLGYGCRQCVSYTAHKVGAQTGNYPRYWGNANMWPSSARAAGYQTGSTPRDNSVGIIMDGQYGHSVWIDSVNDDGSLIISQYNYFNAGGPGWGNYSKMRVSAATYDTFIYF